MHEMVVRAFAHGVMGCQINPSWWTNAVVCAIRVQWDGAYKRFIAANKNITHIIVAVGFLSCYLNGPLLYVQHHITVNKMF